MISQTLTSSFKQELFLAVHDFSTDTFKLALYTAEATLNADTTVYISAGEVSPVYSVNSTAVVNGILEAVVSLEPGYTLFGTTIVDGRALGDITNNSTVSVDDSIAYSEWAAGINTNPEQVAWIEGTLNPYMFANPVAYAAYITLLNGYTLGGIPLTGTTVNLDNKTAFVDFANAVWDSASFTARGGLIYNASKGDKAVAVLDFGADKMAATQFTVTMPANTSTAALIRLP